MKMETARGRFERQRNVTKELAEEEQRMAEKLLTEVSIAASGRKDAEEQSVS